jgi:hypothetical protein
MEIEKRWPWMGITEKPESKGDDKSAGTTAESVT